MDSQSEMKFADQRIVEMLRSEIIRLCDAGRFMQAEKRIEDLAALRCGDIFAETHWNFESRRTDGRMAIFFVKALLERFADNLDVAWSALAILERYGAFRGCEDLIAEHKAVFAGRLGGEFWRLLAWVELCRGDLVACRMHLRRWNARGPADVQRCHRSLDYLRVTNNETVAAEVRTLEARQFSELGRFDVLLYAVVLAVACGASRRVRHAIEELRPSSEISYQRWLIAHAYLCLNTSDWTGFQDSFKGLIRSVENAALFEQLSAERTLRSLPPQRRSKTPIAASPRAFGLAVLLSGCVRTYRCGEFINALRGKFPDWRIDVFAHAFDRLGDLRVPAGIPATHFDYIHGGYEREIAKTGLLDRDRWLELVRPTRWLLEERRPDVFYVEKHGFAHPQWHALYQAFLLADQFGSETGVSYDVILRARYDHDLSGVPLEHRPIEADVVYTPSNLVFGHSDFRINDREGFGTWNSMATYVEIGKGRNFVELESTSLWTKELTRYRDSHETHLGMWLKQRGLAARRLPDFVSKPVDLA